MPLTERQLRAIRPTDSNLKIFDGGGLYLHVNPKGKKTWRAKLKVNGCEQNLTFGTYPDITLAQARRLSDEAKRNMRQGIMVEKPKVQAKAEAEESKAKTFQEVSEEWFRVNRSRWVRTYQARLHSRLHDDAYPVIGDKPIDQITPPDIVKMIRQIEGRGAIEMARRVKQMVSAVFQYAIATGLATTDPASGLHAVLAPPKPIKRRTPLAVEDMPTFLRALDRYSGDPIVAAAIQWTLLTVVRTNETRWAAWSEIEGLDGDEPVWRIPVARMKVKNGRGDHVVPLSDQAAALARRVKALNRSDTLLFPGSGSKGVISENAMLYALYRMGFKDRVTIHGFRASFSTLANEYEWHPDWVEVQLAHVKNDVRAAYNAARYLRQRREMMQWWADFLDQKKTPGA